MLYIVTFRLAAPAVSAAYPDLRGRVAELEAEIARLTKMLAESDDRNQTLLMLLQVQLPHLLRPSSISYA